MSSEEQIKNLWVHKNTKFNIKNNQRLSHLGLAIPNQAINLFEWLAEAIMLLPLSPSGIATLTAGTGINLTGTLANPIVNNSGVLTLTPGTNVTITGTASNPIINSTAGAATNIYNADGTLTGARTLLLNSNTMNFFNTIGTANNIQLNFAPNRFYSQVGDLDESTADSGSAWTLNWKTGVQNIAEIASKVRILATGQEALAYHNTVSYDGNSAGTKASIGVNAGIAGETYLIIAGAAESATIPQAYLKMSTEYQNGTNYGYVPNMVPAISQRSGGANLIRYQFPLQKHALIFGDYTNIVMDGQQSMNCFVTDADGTKQLLKKLQFTCRGAGFESMIIRIVDDLGNVLYNSPTLTFAGTAGIIQTANLDLALANNRVYFAVIVSVTGGTSISTGIAVIAHII